jgi:hypothetical protein
VSADEPPDLSMAVSPALNWLHAVIRGDMATVWAVTDPDLRLALVQSFILGYPIESDNRDDLAGSIARGEMPWWPVFAAWRLERWQNTFTSDMLEWGTRAGHHLVSADLELVVFADHQGGRVRAGTPALMQSFVCRLGGDGVWRVAGIGRAVARPGWPPTKDVVDFPSG